MRPKTIIRPTTTITGDHQLDMRIVPKQGKDLFDIIVRSVEHSQKYILVDLPNKLIVTQQQFASLNNFTEEMYHTTDRMFVTPWNVMEVEIDREVDTIDELEQIIDESENLLALKKQTEEQTSEQA